MDNRSEKMNAYRYQVWITQPYRSNELIGDFSGALDFRHIILFGRAYNSARYSISYLDPRWVNQPKTVVYSPLMRAFFFPDSLELLNSSYGQVKVLGNYVIAGRTALKISWRAPDSSQLKFYWIDTHTGILLRRLEYDIFDRLKKDIIATQIVYDAPIPDHVFDPRLTWAGGFTEDPNGPSTPQEPVSPAPTPSFPPHR
jgi:hypothetical protein